MQLLRSLTLFLIGSGILFYYLWSRPPGPGPVCDPRLEPVLKEWKQDMQQAGLDIEYQLGRLERISIEESSYRAGHADPRSSSILVSDRTLDLGPWTVKATLYHELGHYVFRLNHTDQISIMYKATLPEEYYEENWEGLYNDYLTQCKNHARELKFR